VRSAVAVLVDKGVQEALEFTEGGGLGRLRREPLLHGLPPGGLGFRDRWTILVELRWAWVRGVVVLCPGTVREGQRAVGLLSGGVWLEVRCQRVSRPSTLRRCGVCRM
jgi:hypothetical protein